MGIVGIHVSNQMRSRRDGRMVLFLLLKLKDVNKILKRSKIVLMSDDCTNCRIFIGPVKGKYIFYKVIQLDYLQINLPLNAILN